MQEFGSSPLAVFVAWEPILITDIRGPKTGTLARVWDRRAAQFWDRSHLISESMGGPASFGPKSGAKIQFKMTKHVWDFVGVYPPGFRWKECGASPLYAGAPVVDVIGDVRTAIATALVKPTSAKR